jgi:hypothetical protein
MENILAVVAILALVGFFWFFLSKMIEWRRQKAEAEEKRQQVIAEHLLEVARQSRARAREIRTASMTNAVANTAKVPEPAKPSYAPSTTQSIRNYDTTTSSSDTLSDLANLAIIANTLHHWNDNSRSEPVREERSVGVSKTESSWGFDDSDSRKSISSSMDTSSSWSSSSSSDSYSSSSDSGPSSDW